VPETLILCGFLPFFYRFATIKAHSESEQLILLKLHIEKINFCAGCQTANC
jgi:hypothetical protein